MRQFVHNVSYLVVYSLDLSKSDGATSFEAVALPVGAEVVNVNLNIDEVADVGVTCSVGINEETNKFLNAVALDSKDPHTSAQNLSVSSRGSVNLTLSGGSTKGRITLRVLYFLPTTIKTEY